MQGLAEPRELCQCLYRDLCHNLPFCCLCGRKRQRQIMGKMMGKIMVKLKQTIVTSTCAMYFAENTSRNS